jgi:hypothetical protein
LAKNITGDSQGLYFVFCYGVSLFLSLTFSNSSVIGRLNPLRIQYKFINQGTNHKLVLEGL